MINTPRDLKQETSLFVSIQVFMSSWNFMLSWVEHEKSFITSGRMVKFKSFRVNNFLVMSLNEDKDTTQGL